MTVREAFKAIADAIRRRDGLDESVTFRPSDMPDAIVNEKPKNVSNQALLQGLINRTIDTLDLGSITNIPDGGLINVGASKIVGKNVVSAGDYSLYKDDGNVRFDDVLTEVNFPNLKVIGDYAFANNPLLSGIISNDIESIGNHAFDGDSALIMTDLPANLLYIGESAFNGCESITIHTLPSSLNELNDYSFCSCTGIVEMTVPNGITEIPVSCFSSSSIAKLTLPDSVITIHEYAFSDCSNDEPGIYNIGNSVETIEAGAFSNNSGIKSISFPQTLKTIGDKALTDCYNLAYVHFPNGIDSFGKNMMDNDPVLETVENVVSTDNAVSNCTKLKTASIQGNPSIISEYMFYADAELETVSGCENVGSVLRHAFNGCKSLKNIDLDFNKIVTFGDYAFQNCASLNIDHFSSSLSNLYAQSIFYGCTAIKELRFHSTVSINGGCFENCSNLKDIYVPWKEGDIPRAPWGASNATIHYEFIYPIASFTNSSYSLITKNKLYNGSYTPKINGIDKDGYPTSASLEDISWSLTESEYATINPLTGEMTITNAPIGTVFNVTAKSENYGSSQIKIIIINAYFTIDLNNGQWVDSGTKIGNNIVYKSDAGSYHINSGQSLATITLSGYTKFVVYIRSYAESTYDYTQAFGLDVAASRGATSVQTTSGNQSATQYYKAEYTIPDENEHTIQILYSKDSGGDSDDDRGYFYVAEDECE